MRNEDKMMKFSERQKLAGKVHTWCFGKGISPEEPMNVIAAITDMGYTITPSN